MSIWLVFDDSTHYTLISTKQSQFHLREGGLSLLARFRCVCLVKLWNINIIDVSWYIQTKKVSLQLKREIYNQFNPSFRG